MVVEKGFKQTVLGVIPLDWSVETLKDACTYRRGSFPQPYGLSIWYDEINGAPFVQVFDIDSNWKIKPFTKRYISELAQRQSVYAPKGSIVLTIQGSIGRIAITQYDAFVDRTLLIFESFKIKFDKIYFCLAIESLFEKERQNAPGGIIKTITKEALSSFLIPIPPLPEQIAIATTLSDMDALIAQTEKLLEKKKAIKQGVMQELLRPKEGWVNKKLGDFGKTYGGITGKGKADFGFGGSRYIPFMNIMANPVIDIEHFDVVNINSGEFQNKVQCGDLFFNGSSETPEEVGLCSVLDKDVNDLYLNSFCFGYRMNNANDFNGYFLAYLFRSPLGRKFIYSLAQGATRYNLSKTSLMKLELPIPNKKEQDSIANIIIDIDNEISIRNKKLQKLKLEKQGMMQALLTGKIRLV